MKYPRYFINDDELFKYWRDGDLEYIAKGNHVRHYVEGQLTEDHEYDSEEKAFQQIDHIFFSRNR